MLIPLFCSQVIYRAAHGKPCDGVEKVFMTPKGSRSKAQGWPRFLRPTLGSG